MNRGTALFLLAVLVFLAPSAGAQGWLIPPPLEPSRYGNLLMSRNSIRERRLPATFSHWSHRRHYTCRVCHLELEFAMELGATDVTEEDNLNGLYCGACHDGKQAFGHTEEHCPRCHNADLGYGEENFDAFSYFPESDFGNKVDWVRALREGRITPKRSLYDEKYSPMEFDTLLELKAEWTRIPPAIFPHDAHNEWLDCANCHPDIFNIKKKTTKHFAMEYILEAKFCGVCHLTTAFPLDDCRRCHPAMEEQPVGR